MYEGVIETANKLKDQRKELSTKRESQANTSSQTDLINKTNMEVAKHLVRFMHEYMTSIEVKNLPQDLVKTGDINRMLKSLDDLITSRTVTTTDLTKNLNSGIEDLITAVDGLRGITANNSEVRVCEELRSVQAAITKANTAVLKGDKTKDVISAVKTLEKAVKGLKMAPVVNVAPTKVDLSGIEKKIAEIPGKIKIPQIVVPENDYSVLEQSVKNVQNSIENIVFPVAEFPTTVKVTNTDGSEVSPTYGVARIDDASDPAYYGFENNSGEWYILRNTDSTGLWEYYAGTGGITTNWAGRAGYTYADKGAIF